MLGNCAAIHDLSCYAKSSLTVVIPVLETMGVEVCPLPTALLSSQTDGFDSYTFRSTTDDMTGILEAWKGLGIHFDALYSGFLGDEKQVALIDTLIDEQRRLGSPLVLVDPVLGDDGRLYGPTSDEQVDAMRALACRADFLTPNTTEAALLLRHPYQQRFTRIEALQWAEQLHHMTGASIAITSVPLEDCSVVACCADDKAFLVEYRHLDVTYPGCGDLFASLLLGFLFRKHTFQTSVQKAVFYTTKAIELTMRRSVERRHGVCPSLIIPDLVKETVL